MHPHTWACTHMLPNMCAQNLKFHCTIGLMSNDHNSLNLNANYVKIMFKFKSRMSTFQWNKPHSKIICHSKAMIKIVRKWHFSVSFSKQFETLLSCDYFQTLWSWHIKLIIGPETKVYYLGTKWDVYTHLSNYSKKEVLF